MGAFSFDPYDQMAGQQGRNAAVVAGIPASGADAYAAHAQEGFKERNAIMRQDVNNQQQMMNAGGLGQMLMMMMMLNRGDTKSVKMGPMSVQNVDRTMATRGNPNKAPAADSLMQWLKKYQMQQGGQAGAQMGGQMSAMGGPPMAQMDPNSAMIQLLLGLAPWRQPRYYDTEGTPSFTEDY